MYTYTHRVNSTGGQSEAHRLYFNCYLQICSWVKSHSSEDDQPGVATGCTRHDAIRQSQAGELRQYTHRTLLHIHFTVYCLLYLHINTVTDFQHLTTTHNVVHQTELCKQQYSVMYSAVVYSLTDSLKLKCLVHPDWSVKML